MILLVNGPNLNLLGEREPEVYGSTTLAEIERLVTETCAQYGVEVRAFQSNWEGAILDFLQEHRHAARGVILNPGALTHTSYALHDCLKAIPAPTIEVHLSNVHAREPFRRQSVVSPAVKGVIAGLGPSGYWLAAIQLCTDLARTGDTDAPPAAEAAAAAPAAAAAARDPARPFARAPEPDQGGEHSVGPGTFGERVVEITEIGGTPEEIPVDRSKRGDYEPL